MLYILQNKPVHKGNTWAEGENTTGLLFSFKENTWMVKYNK